MESPLGIRTEPKAGSNQKRRRKLKGNVTVSHLLLDNDIVYAVIYVNNLISPRELDIEFLLSLTHMLDACCFLLEPYNKLNNVCLHSPC